jgi:hypothetical protein
MIMMTSTIITDTTTIDNAVTDGHSAEKIADLRASAKIGGGNNQHAIVEAAGPRFQAYNDALLDPRSVFML